MRKMRTYSGWQRDLPNHNDLSYALHSGEFEEEAETPDEVDLDPVMPPIWDQGPYNDCVAFGGGAALEHMEILSIAKDAEKEPEWFSKQYEPLSKFFLYYGAKNIDGTTNVDNGTQVRSLFKAASTWGMCRDKLWPYLDGRVNTHPDFHCYEEASKHKLVDKFRIDNSNLNEILQCLANGFPITFGMALGESWRSDEVQRTGIIPELQPGELIIGGHCMCLVGYKKATRLMKVRNSWSALWGDKGHAWIPFDMITGRMAADFWTLRKNLQAKKITA